MTRLTDVKNSSSLCVDCAFRAKCCTRQADPPDLTRYDINKIIHYVRNERPDLSNDFFKKLEHGRGAALIRMPLKRDGTCIFLSNDRECAIYAFRPIDCQLFPLDIYWENGTYYWILYNDFCDYSSQLDEIQSEMQKAEETLLPRFKESELWAYAQHHSRLFKSGQWIKLRQVDLRFKRFAESVTLYAEPVAREEENSDHKRGPGVNV